MVDEIASPVYAVFNNAKGPKKKVRRSNSYQFNDADSTDAVYDPATVTGHLPVDSFEPTINATSPQKSAHVYDTASSIQLAQYDLAVVAGDATVYDQASSNSIDLDLSAGNTEPVYAEASGEPTEPAQYDFAVAGDAVVYDQASNN